jgi:hypothetical protein
VPTLINERANGATKPAARTAVRTAVIELGGDYEGWQATMRVNPTLAVWEDFSSGDEGRLAEALKVLVVEWNVPDDDGNPLPLPKDGLDWKTAPFDLKLRLVNGYNDAMTRRISVGKEQPINSEPTSPNAT